MSWKLALGLSVFWAAFAVWVWLTGGAAVFAIGAPVLALALAVTAVVRYRREHRLPEAVSPRR